MRGVGGGSSDKAYNYAYEITTTDILFFLSQDAIWRFAFAAAVSHLQYFWRKTKLNKTSGTLCIITPAHDILKLSVCNTQMGEHTQSVRSESCEPAL